MQVTVLFLSTTYYHNLQGTRHANKQCSKQTTSVAFAPRANYTYRVTAACRRS
jgi:hypothetical protein